MLNIKESTLTSSPLSAFDGESLEGAFALRARLHAMLTQNRFEAVRRAQWEGCPSAEIANLIVDTTREALQEADIVVWDPDLWGAATRRANEAWDAHPETPPTVAVGTSQLWLARRFFFQNNDSAQMAEAFNLPQGSSVLAIANVALNPTRYDESLLRNSNVKKGELPPFDGAMYVLMFFPPVTRGRAPIAPFPPFLRALPPAYVHSRVPPGCGAFVAAMEFMQMDFIEVRSEEVPRQEGTGGRPAPPPSMFKRVVLRRFNVSNEKSEEGEATDSRFQCQWLVRAHWRRPSKTMKKPRPVFVRAHIKGPGEMPLRSYEATVFEVSR